MKPTLKKGSATEVVDQFKKLNSKEKIKVAELINKEAFHLKWKELDRQLPQNADISEDEIMKNVRAVRYGRKEKN